MRIAVIAVMATSSWVQANPDIIKLRDGLMGQNDQAMKILVLMARGKIDFDVEVATAILSQVRNTSTMLPALFPDGSDTGGDTIAGPQIFSDRAGFAAAADKTVQDAEAAIGAVDADGVDGLVASLRSVGSNCTNCHKAWRTKP